MYRNGLKETPKRFYDSLCYLTSGNFVNVDEVVGDAIFSSLIKGPVVQTGIRFYSICEHHLLPFYGIVNISYISSGKVLGLSKICRIINVFSRRLQIQERLTCQLSGAINYIINPQAIALSIKARHFCMLMRGIQQHEVQVMTLSFLGTYKVNSKLRKEFLYTCNGY